MDPLLKAEETDPAVARLTEIETMFVSLVDRGANRQSKFFVVKADGEYLCGKCGYKEKRNPGDPMEKTCPECGAMMHAKSAGTKADQDRQGQGPGGMCVCPKCGYSEAHKTGEQCAEKTCPKCGNKGMVRKVEETAKQVPPADATPDAKREAQQKRAAEFGIQALESNANLSYPKGDPTQLSLYGDPVNLKYPLGREDNKRDRDRIASAVSYFRTNYKGYTEKASQVRVFSRIIEAGLAEGMEISYRDDHPVDKALPGTLKDRMKKNDPEDGDDAESNGSEAGSSSSVSMDEWLEGAAAQVEGLLVDHTIDAALTAEAEANGEPEPPTEKTGECDADTGSGTPSQGGDEPPHDDTTVATERAEKAEREAAELRKQLAAKVKKEREQRAKIAKLKASIGSSTALPTGETTAEPRTQKRVTWGGDLAEQVKDQD